MTQEINQGLTMSKWHKCPNVLVDKLMGEILSPSAACVVLTIWRLTEGVRERHQASIPTETFMRVTGTKRKNTAYQYVNEAVTSGLVTVKKEQGKVNVYSINKDCPLWYGNEVVAESVPTTESATSVDKRNIVVAESATGLAESSGGKRNTYKDIVNKDSVKDKKKEKPKPKPKPKFDALSYPIPSFIEQENWNDFVAMRKEIKKPLTETACKRLVKSLIEFDANGFDVNDSLNSSIMNQYQGVFEKSRKQQSNNQVNRNGINQSVNSQPKQSSADVYAAKLAEQRRQREAANTTATGSDRANVYDMEETF